ncbi:cobalamin biosynthesis protein CobW [Rhizobium sp. Leaf384]|uniref:CobW family GTP-binding protein n=1 Tax=unclassified Rhizobium TaxID=2613769 RepID=UPI00071292B5|nr:MULTISPECIES: GTP-binding protein [unclassified Rhizobium]KQS81309.1 cobalamin biosynthesis protein CobW [Rhizobium sp. Leaf384]KQS87217.1 cobalamin biosynthesis protein CobW [Rhizobium sp. Leaf383]
MTRDLITASVLTGFLGAGKTTLLNRLLSGPDLADTAVIINEFGDIGLDHLLVESVDGDIVLLKSGCVCCTVRGDLKDAVLALFERRARGDIPAFRRLVIETTGLADPAPIIATLAADLMLKYHFAIGNVVTAIDVPNGLHNLEAFEEAGRQVALADRIVLTKADLASGQDLEALRLAVEAINPAAIITTTIVTTGRDSRDKGQARSSEVAALLTQDIHDLASRPAEARRWVAAARHGDHVHATPDRNRHGDIRAMSLTIDRPIAWARFSLWLSLMVHRHGTRILRLKGILDIEGVGSPVVVHGVRHLIHPPFHLADWPCDRASLLVLITDGDLGDIQRSLRAFVGAQAEVRASVPART